MGWLRIVRPGSVIGEQQRYLCDMEPAIARIRACPAAVHPALAGLASDAATAAEAGVGLAAVERLWERIRGTVDRQGAFAPAVASGAAAEALAAHVGRAAERRSAGRGALHAAPMKQTLREE
jgi:hypothetical protein